MGRAAAKPKGPLKCRCGCGRIATRRGLWINCYQAAARLVRLKITTWAKLEQEQIVDPPAKRGRRPRGIGQQVAALAK